jgi:drug/metabolite transporter (DMT)-like permease
MADPFAAESVRIAETEPRGRRLGRALRSGASGNAYLLLVLTMAMWGANAVAGRLAVDRVSPMALVALRWMIVAAILVPLTRRRMAEEWPVMRERWRAVLAMGAIGFTGVNAMYFLSAHYTTALHMAILQGSMPVFVLLGALAWHRTRIRAVQMVGVVLTIAGIATVASKGHLSVLRDLAFNPGDLLVLGMAVLYSAYTVGLRDRPKVSGTVFFTAMALVALVTSLPLLGFEIATGRVLWPTPMGWLVVVFIALFPSLTAQLMFLRAVDLIGPGRAGLFINLVPVFGALLAIGILGEPFGLYHALALVLVLSGIFLAERPAWRAPR